MWKWLIGVEPMTLIFFHLFTRLKIHQLFVSSLLISHIDILVLTS